jgi:hypothetical protein
MNTTNVIIQTNSSSPTSSPSTSSSTSSATSTLSEYANRIFSMSRYQLLYQNILKEYTSTRKKLQSKIESLNKFKAKSNNGSLPHSMQLSILNKVKLPEYEQNADLFKSFIEEMKKLELETNTKLASIVTRQKEHEIKYLQNLLTHETFITSSVDKIKLQLTKDAATVKSTTSTISTLSTLSTSSSPNTTIPSTSDWPIGEITACIKDKMKDELTSIDLTLEEEILFQQDEKERKDTEELSIQKQVNEQSAAQTMGKIMQHTTNVAVRPIHEQLQRLKQQMESSAKHSSSHSHSQAHKKRDRQSYEPAMTFDSIEEAERTLNVDIRSQLKLKGGDKTKNKNKQSKFISQQ